jgi:predicted Rdx family selenoprotein
MPQNSSQSKERAGMWNVPGFPKIRESKAKVRDVASGLTTFRLFDGYAEWKKRKQDVFTECCPDRESGSAEQLNSSVGRAQGCFRAPRIRLRVTLCTSMTRRARGGWMAVGGG